MPTFTSLDVTDVRFPTSQSLDGSDAMNKDPDYSAAYLELTTSEGETGTSLVFTIGRGNDVQSEAIRALSHHVLGRGVDEVLADIGAAGAAMIADSQLRWLGPEKGVMQMAIGAVVNALWDLRCMREGRPLWRVLADLTPEQLVDLVDFRYLEDALTRAEALEILEAARPGRDRRIAELEAEGYPAYTTTPGWLGYSDEKLERLLREARDAGFDMVKLKVGADLEDDLRRFAITRRVLGEDFLVATDANQRWGVEDAVAAVGALSAARPYWIEEPTSPDDVLAHAEIRRRIAPVRVATGEHVHNRIMFKQLLQAGAVDVVQIDATRVGGIHENLAILLLAAKFGVPVCPHAGGVGLCEMVQHLAMLDFVAITGTMEDRRIEYVDHLHEHFVEPVRIQGGRYLAPQQPGIGARMLPASIQSHRFPDGPVWKELAS
ncbi:enolase C-terminal domain-like protein [Brachybacterium phenoliresistens]|uniref:Fuconate dehydratase n=1 Tax=Brachybacterium phenoliresistens TaxID=396014 RepID=Z9JRG0_9MICO|nr:enolase C-terminal domain-like protein [Brachybacterium phenoliresistens]EWS80583.1 fuconate dehydratase [Brachybacterium phenoliresistens]